MQCSVLSFSAILHGIAAQKTKLHIFGAVEVSYYKAIV